MGVRPGKGVVFVSVITRIESIASASVKVWPTCLRHLCVISRGMVSVSVTHSKAGVAFVIVSLSKGGALS